MANGKSKWSAMLGMLANHRFAKPPVQAGSPGAAHPRRRLVPLITARPWVTGVVLAGSLVLGGVIFRLPTSPFHHETADDLELDDFPEIAGPLERTPPDTPAESSERSPQFIEVDETARLASRTETESLDGPPTSAAIPVRHDPNLLPISHETQPDNRSAGFQPPRSVDLNSRNSGTQGAWLTGTIETEDGTLPGAAPSSNDSLRRR